LKRVTFSGISASSTAKIEQEKDNVTIVMANVISDFIMVVSLNFDDKTTVM
jgi:hypothetical protein